MLMATCASALAYGWGGVLAVRHVLEVGTVVSFVFYLARLYGPLTGLSNIQVRVMSALVYVERVFEVLDRMPMINHNPSPSPFLRHPSVSPSTMYPSAIPLLRRSHLPLSNPSSNQTRLLVRSSRTTLPSPLNPVSWSPWSDLGRWQTTITHLVARVYDVQTCAVSINGMDVHDATHNSLQSRVGVVTQDAHVFHDSTTQSAQVIFTPTPPPLIPN
jgi:ATP-binding cassette subfamily B protein